MLLLKFGLEEKENRTDLHSWIAWLKGLRHKDGLQKDRSMSRGRVWVIWGWVATLVGLPGESSLTMTFTTRKLLVKGDVMGPSLARLLRAMEHGVNGAGNGSVRLQAMITSATDLPLSICCTWK